MDTRAKIIDFPKAVALAAELRATGRRLVVADGCFDVLRAAHTRFLERLRSDGALLLVAVYDDATLCRLLSQSQSILSASARAQMVAALASVDYVLLWPDSSLDRLLSELHPDQAEHVPEGRNIIGEILDRHK